MEEEEEEEDVFVSKRLLEGAIPLIPEKISPILFFNIMSLLFVLLVLDFVVDKEEDFVAVAVEVMGVLRNAALMKTFDWSERHTHDMSNILVNFFVGCIIFSSSIWYGFLIIE